MDHYTASHLALGAARLEMTSARPDAPVVAAPERARPDLRARARIAAYLHRLAAILEPRQGRDRKVSSRVEATTACR
jgi:hypothetical protein